jgi:hypothetical protein
MYQQTIVAEGKYTQIFSEASNVQAVAICFDKNNV